MAGRLGTAYLSRVMNTELIAHIHDALPDIKSRITKMLVDIQHVRTGVTGHAVGLRSQTSGGGAQEMETLGDPVEEQSAMDQGHTLLMLLSNFASS